MDTRCRMIEVRPSVILVPHLYHSGSFVRGRWGPESRVSRASRLSRECQFSRDRRVMKRVAH